MKILAYFYSPKYLFKYRIVELVRENGFLIWRPYGCQKDRPTNLPRLPCDFHIRSCLIYQWETRYFKEGDL